MNCHKDKNNSHKSHSPVRHMLHMIICCGLPILIIGVLPVMKFLSPSLKTAIATVTPFICPIMMMLMIPMMFRGMGKGKDCCNRSEENVPHSNVPENIK